MERDGVEQVSRHLVFTVIIMTTDPDPLAVRIPRVAATHLKDSDQLAEQALHKAMWLVEGGRASERRSIDRLPVLVVAWNRCTDAERDTFIKMLRQAVLDAARYRVERAERINPSLRVVKS
jgi:hypothetical protein